MNKTILVVTAHADDKVLGCGGNCVRVEAVDGFQVVTVVE
jgi:LmbE family N-acetylglucosaminyl deacetylase